MHRIVTTIEGVSALVSSNITDIQNDIADMKTEIKKSLSEIRLEIRKIK